MAQSITLPDPVTNDAAEKIADATLNLETKTKEIRRPKIAVAEKTTSKSAKGLKVKRLFTRKETEAFNMVEYEKRTSKITEPDGTVVFEMKGIEVPKTWSQLATDIVAQKYFRKRGVPGETGHETSVKQLIHRVARTVRVFGEEKGYFASKEDAETFEQELKYLCLTQHGAFNSPVWFNCGLYHEYGVIGDSGNYAWNFELGEITEIENAYSRPQCSACFIQSVDDSLMGIFELAKTEAKLFKYGSGTGSNFSAIRSKYETLSGGGVSSGLMSFLEVLDRGAGAIKSGGTTRRAAKMVTLDIDHPEIRDFINWKVESEKKAKVLIDAGYDSDWRGEAYKTVSGQNSNNSVRVDDKFMNAVADKKSYWTKKRDGSNHEEVDAQDLFEDICKAAWSCADPGLQFDTTINNWHSCPNTDRINGSNPCSEYMFLDDSACNLASLNLVKFMKEDGEFDVPAFRHAARIFTIAQEIFVDLSAYPTKGIAENSHKFRPLGLGYANLGTLLMLSGKPYDSNEGRSTAAAITAILHCHAYSVSAELAKSMGTFDEYELNKKPMLKIMRQHQKAAHKINKKLCPTELLEAAKEDADRMVEMGEKHGYRNAQVTVLAPTGTIGLLMDCDTTGVEPEFSLVKWKKLAGGGHFKIINKSIPLVLDHLGYGEQQVQDMTNYVLGYGDTEEAPHVNPISLKKLGFNDKEINKARKHVKDAKTLDEWTTHINPAALESKGLSKQQIAEAKLFIEGSQTLEGAPHIKEEHLSVFDCANKCGTGKRFIAAMGHINMMAAVQPFLSGAISKTVNIPNESTVKDIYNIYIESWKVGIKAIALYRDGSKHSQPLSAKSDKENEDAKVVIPEGFIERGTKLDLPTKRRGITIEASIAGQKLYIRTGEYDDGNLGELFIDSFKEGASYRSLLNCFAVAVSVGLQYGVPLEKYVDSFSFTRFEPSGFTTHPNIRTCTSIVDFIFRVLGMEYLGRTDFVHVEPTHTQMSERQAEGKIKQAMIKEATIAQEDKMVSTKTFEQNNALDKQLEGMMGDAPACTVCGHITVRNASCYKCLNCGASMGCS